MSKNFIFKIKRGGKEQNSMLAEREFDVCVANMEEDFKEFMILLVFEIPEEKSSEKLRKSKISLNNLHKLIKKGFTIRLDKVDNNYNLVVYKGTCSISFTANGGEGILDVLMQAEDWAETMLEDLKVNTSCEL